MLQTIKEAIDSAMTDPSSDAIEWVHTAAEIVEGTEVVLEVVAAGGTGAISTAIGSLLEDTAAGVALPVAGAAAAVAGEFAAIGAGYAEAAKKIKEDRSSTGFAEGAVIGAMKETADFIKTNFVRNTPDQNDFWPEGGVLAQHYYNGALVLGYRYGYELDNDETAFFWKDLARGLPEPIPISPDAQSSPDDHQSEWVDWFIKAGAQFLKLHITADSDSTASAA